MWSSVHRMGRNIFGLRGAATMRRWETLRYDAGEAQSEFRVDVYGRITNLAMRRSVGPKLTQEGRSWRERRMHS